MAKTQWPGKATISNLQKRRMSKFASAMGKAQAEKDESLAIAKMIEILRQKGIREYNGEGFKITIE